MTPGNPVAVTQTAAMEIPAEMDVMASLLHGKQDVPPGGDVKPVGQGAQVALEVAPSDVDDVAAGHFVHAGEPSDALYVPWIHA